MSTYEHDRIQPGYAHYREPLDVVIDLDRTRVSTLLLHDSKASLQQAVDQFTRTLAANDFDRLAMPGPSEKVRDFRVLTDWIEMLRNKHGFNRLIVAEPVRRYQKSARSILAYVFPSLKVDFEVLEDEEIEPPGAIVAHCADPRFQNAFDELIAKQDLGTYERLSFPGAALALKNEAAVRWVAEPMEAGGIGEVHLMNHTDCAVVGGLSAHHDIEYDEAVKHADSFSEASARVRNIKPDQVPKVVEHIVGIDGIWDIKSLKNNIDQARTLE